ncbi:MAG: hypothetical protein CSA25_05245 [Desulfobacter postgatei]|uniref:Uncharacterized protein n=1 Tax=Desulfobacter postgatei TaxID=2293 RepID=A0A2G6MQQ5_9BACT|nr:MAG: hypothetical protein CSA25_05245 [Desulfobacter postgatei]
MLKNDVLYSLNPPETKAFSLYLLSFSLRFWLNRPLYGKLSRPFEQQGDILSKFIVLAIVPVI